jgi:serine/threonine protein kinase
MGTMGYLSPEVVLSTHYTNKTDLWAVAVIVYEMTHGRAFVEGATDKEKYRWLRNVTYRVI